MPEEIPDHTVDRTGWGAGPWDGEPDRVEWRSPDGVPCLMVRHPNFGHWCGYAAVPPGHPWWGKHHSKLDLSAHWAVNYSRTCSDLVCHVAGPGEPERVWWLGFDCGHAFDVSPGSEALLRLGRALMPNFLSHEEELTEMKERLDALVAPEVRAAMTPTYKTEAYVRSFVEDLARQIVEAMR